jgi:cytochrome c oxidase subunit 6a
VTAQVVSRLPSKAALAHNLSIHGKLTRVSSGVAPCLLLAGGNAWYLWKEHWEHWSHMPPLEERPEYPYQNIRTKNFQWGDGDKVSSFSH